MHQLKLNFSTVNENTLDSASKQSLEVISEFVPFPSGYRCLGSCHELCLCSALFSLESAQSHARYV